MVMENQQPKPERELNIFADLKARPDRPDDIEIGGVIEMKPQDLMPMFDLATLRETVKQHRVNIDMFLEGIAEEEKQIEFIETLIAQEEERQRLVREDGE